MVDRMGIRVKKGRSATFLAFIMVHVPTKTPDNKPLETISFYDDHYLECQRAFEKASPWTPDLNKWIHTHLGSRVLEKLDSTLPEGGQLKLLGIGSGEGEVEYNLITRLLSKYPTIHNTVVDPSQTQLDLYKDLIKEKAPELDGVQYDWHAKTLAQYRHSSEESGDRTKFHFISALFCLYYEADLYSSLEYLLSRLEPGGVLLAAMETDRCDVMKIEERFQFGADSDDVPLYCFTDMTAHFEKRGVPFAVLNQPDDQRDFDVTAIFDESSREGALLLDFISSVANFRQVAPPGLLADFLSYVRSLATLREGRVLLFYDTDYVLASKPKFKNHFV
ncbi:histamine N-methyltransferase B-like isoform X2 [Patiria miniata]|uniref:Histamine N-methyltransferase n=1 Tax=Patiria miniata TaxID=46514 RepID=A0A914BR95_PATMI|nr:histamine N-methyltransferase B-like isoform X2 [Patiria miniata]